MAKNVLEAFVNILQNVKGRSDSQDSIRKNSMRFYFAAFFGQLCIFSIQIVNINLAMSES